MHDTENTDRMSLILSDKGKNMKLINISVGGFRNVDEQTLNLSSITSLVSLNSYGKSNLLRAIDFGIEFISASEPQKNDMMSWPKGIPLNKHIPSKNFIIEIEAQTIIKGEEYYIQYGYEFVWVRNDDNGKKIVKEWLKVKETGINQKYNMYIDRDENKVDYRTSKTGRCDNKILIEDSELIINKIKAYDNLFYLNIVKQINQISVHIIRHFDADDALIPDIIVRKDTEALQLENTENLPRVLHCLQDKHRDRYDLLVDSFLLLFPQITDITVESVSFTKHKKSRIPKEIPFTYSNEIYRIYVTDENLNQPIDFKGTSDGMKRILLLLTSIVLADINKLPLIAIEEPENSIHPSLMQSFIQILAGMRGDCAIIITSHSPYMLQYLDPEDIYIGIPNDKGIAKFIKVKKSRKKSLMNDAGKYSRSVGDYVFELMSGSDDDVKELKSYLEK